MEATQHLHSNGILLSRPQKAPPPPQKQVRIQNPGTTLSSSYQIKFRHLTFGPPYFMALAGWHDPTIKSVE